MTPEHRAKATANLIFPHPRPNLHGADRPRCEATAKATGQRCRRQTGPHPRFCFDHTPGAWFKNNGNPWGDRPRKTGARASGDPERELRAMLDTIGGTVPRELRDIPAWRDPVGDTDHSRAMAQCELLRAWIGRELDNGAAWRNVLKRYSKGVAN